VRSGGEVLQFGCLIAYGLVLIVAAWRDWRTLRIADAFPLTIVGVFGIWAVSGLASGLLIAGAVAFAIGALGGGDAKLLAAASLLAGPAFLVEFLLVVALAGGAVSLIVLMGLAGETLSARDEERHRRVPYGPAIAAGGLAVALARIVG
jgi:prepilin peptidase CpaA